MINHGIGNNTFAQILDVDVTMTHFDMKEQNTPKSLRAAFSG
jgi:hypothetical protein